MPCRHLQGGFVTAGVSKHVTPAVELSLKHHDFQKDAYIPQLQVCRRLHASCYKLLICPAEKPRHYIMHETSKRSLPPETLSREYRARWTVGKATWNAFAGIPCQVDSGKRHLEHFCRNTVAGGRQEKLPGTLSREFRARWKAGSDTWNTFAGKPWQVDSAMGHLERFCRKTVAGGRQEKTPGTLLQGFRARWTARGAT